MKNECNKSKFKSNNSCSTPKDIEDFPHLGIISSVSAAHT